MDLLDFDLDIDLSAIQVSIAAEENNIWNALHWGDDHTQFRVTRLLVYLAMQVCLLSPAARMKLLSLRHI